ncbi:TetR/AcrR family transcriptional regulator [Cryobacterium sp. TMT1-21]|uniref:TetR/AcrR family transcriptional regulator n=1 Tax=Cryobacterium shii TaxID=1259235 RepID=A0AAQ2C4A1_9MICO|nr:MULTISPECIES: TetR/AcrR family transcriptional regulator [Cryobacterium]TFC42543.1 TetR/AcrR family transcriptional regulator [Cryobacterium shii]TFC80875.1 TetR/AcrR family transcriptional regulator [Cryobacterium sp. TmT2-59]TFD13198.1 TetR/AcrR family transcriptional regulator [Cryobacterium sp. TMT1-21]TFD18619.1 TetR/AcrR family transcriptional regulator [Cryobacterium sp. TMT4-10]TFD28419.1 TetR/AcrR family transcriptional regulator [Cryobacterium sp. TMT2-23]
MTRKPARARSLSVEDRQSMIIDAVTPLLIEHGQGVTTRQIAECAGIAEGTIFRAFDSKDELIRAVVARQLDPEPLRVQLAAVDLALPLEERVGAIVGLLRARFARVFTILNMAGSMGRPHTHEAAHEFTEMLAHLLAPDFARLSVPPIRAAQIIRMVALAASVPQIRSGAAFDDDELTALILYGIAGAPARPIATP